MKKTDKDKLKIDKPAVKSDNLFPVVGIGASAGGLDAFKKLLKAIPEDSGMAYVLVQHLDPSHESMLPELLQKVTKIPVLEISDDIKVEPNHIYVIPSNKMMVATDGILLLAPRPPKSKNERNLPIDLFFNSLAEVHQAHAIGVVLSGTASDGTLGLKAIKDNGGITFAQDEASAAYEGMPHSAAQAGVVDFILPPEKIPEKLLEVMRITKGNGGDEQNFPVQDEDVFKNMLSLLRIRKGTDFTYYKQTTIRRRILRRMALNKNEAPADYLKYLRENKAEQDVLYQDLLIPVTSFFRDPKSFDNLCETVFPHIVKNKTGDEPIRIWVAGCSTGEEAYSVAICFKEFLGENQERIQIFATDISEPAIAKARMGIYSKNDVDAVSSQRLQEFFTKTNGSYQVNKNVRDICVFAIHNFLKDPPFGRMDFISCRNVLIYMESYLQKKALTTFHYSLNPKGFLLLGKSETTSGVPDLFASAIKNDKIFSPKDVPGRFIQVASQRSEITLSHTDAGTKSENMRTDFQKTADDILLSRYTPAGVVVNEAMDIVNFRGSTGNYLEQSPGKPSHNLLKMAKQGLAFELRNILHKAKKDKISVIKENIPLQINDSLCNISIEAIPLPNTIEPYYLILFHDNNSLGNKSVPLSKKRISNSKAGQDDKDLRIQQLEEQLAQIREDMRSITEEQEAANEELQSANEELLSGSEELQSLNEELETNKEELQSTNEELTVVNHEVINLNEQVTEARDYAESIIATMHEPLIILDKNFRIKTVNQAFYKTFHLKEEQTLGVFLYDLGNKQWNIPRLRELLEGIIPENSHFHNFELTHNFPNIGEKTMLLNASRLIQKSQGEQLILLTFADITEVRQLAIELQVNEKKALEKQLEVEKKAVALIEASNKRYNMMLMQSPFAFAILKGKEMIISLANDSIKEMWGKGKDIEGKSLFEVLPEIENKNINTLLDNVYTTGIPFQGYEFLVPLKRKGKLEDVYFNFVNQPYMEADETISGITIIASEVTLEVNAKKRIEESEERFRQLADLVPQKISNADAAGRVFYFNQNWVTYSGLSMEELMGNGWSKIIHPDEVEEITKQWQHSLETGNDFDVELQLLNKEGEYKWHLSHVSAVKDDNGKIIKWIGTATEIQDQVEQRNALEKAKKMAELKTQIAEDAVKAKQQFLSNMSHEIRTPMNAIVGFTNVVLKTKLDESQKEYINAIKISGDALIILINDILDLAKVDAGKMTFEQIPFNLSTSISSMLQLFELKINEKNLQLIKEYDDTIPQILIGDSMRLRQIILNLVSNAIKFTTQGKITLNVRILKENIKNITIKFTLTDTGIGIHEDRLEQIFHNFEQEHKAIRNSYGGTGLGLAIVKQLVELQGGTIDVKSELGKGSTFSFILSFQKTDNMIETNEKFNKVIQTDIESDMKNVKVLVAEDVALNQLLIKLIILEFGFEIDIVANGQLAVEKLQNNHYDIILMDLQMPEMDGFEATTYIRNTLKSPIPIIALTADVTTVDVERCQAVGMNDYISKPIDEKLLYSKIIKCLKRD